MREKKKKEPVEKKVAAPRKGVVEKKFVINNKLGLHARPAALFVQTANQFECDVEVRKGRQKVNGKSIMGIMTLAVMKGSSITVSAEGVDSELAVEEIGKLIENDFWEGEEVPK